MALKSCSFFVYSILLLSGFACLLHGYGGDDGFWLPVAGGILSLGMLSGSLFCRAQTLRERQPRLGVLCLLALYALSILTLAWSANGFISAKGVLLFTALLYMGAVIYAHPWREVCVLLWAANMIVAAFVAIGFLQLAGLIPCRHWHNAQFAGPFVNSASWGFLVAAFVPVTLGLGFSPIHPALRVSSLIMAGMGSVALVLIPVRTVWLLVAVLYPCMGVVLWSRRSSDTRLSMRQWIILGLVFLTAMVAVGVGNAGIRQRFAELRESRGQSLWQRAEIWALSARMIKHHPAGVGLGGFGEMDLRYKTTLDRFSAGRAHNELLQVTAELGWVAVIPMTLGVLAFFRSLVIWLRAPPSLRDPLQTGLYTALLIAGGHSLVDFPLRLPANALYALLLLAALPTQGGSTPTLRAESPSLCARARGPVLVVVAVMAVVAWGSCAVAGYFSIQGRAALRQGNFMEARERLGRAHAWMPLDPDVLASLAALAHVARPSGAGDVPGGPRMDPLSLLTRATRVAPYRASLHVQRARALAARGEADAAEKAFRAAMVCDPTLGVFSVHLADFLVSQGRLLEAADAYREALEKFHDSPVVDLRRFLSRLRAGGAGAETLRAAAPSDAASQTILRKYLDAIDERRP